MQNAETVLGVLKNRGRRRLPVDELYRQLFNPALYLLAYGRIYANKGALTPGVDEQTADGMSVSVITRIIEEMRQERYRFTPGAPSAYSEVEGRHPTIRYSVVVRQTGSRSGAAAAGGVLRAAVF